MIHWLTDEIGTGAYDEVVKLQLNSTVSIIDVRDLVDKVGNDKMYVLAKINTALAVLKDCKKVVICCDYGMSRSNSVAIGVIAQRYNIALDEAVSLALKVVDESGIKVEMLNIVYEALKPEKQVKDEGLKNIFITGGSGFIGTELKKKLTEEEYTIYSPGSKELNLSSGNILFDIYVKARNIKTIVHLAHPRVLTNISALGESLVMMKNVLEICRVNQIRLVYVSSWEVYSGYTGEQKVITEATATNPKGTYGEIKWLCEQLLQTYVKNYNLNYQVIRLTPVYGSKSERPKFLYTFINKASENKDIVTHRYSNTFPTIDLLYIDDAVKALAMVIASDFKGEINVSTDDGRSKYEIAKVIKELTRSGSKLDTIKIKENIVNVRLDNKKMKTMFNWKPDFDVYLGIRQLLNK